MSSFIRCRSFYYYYFRTHHHHIIAELASGYVAGFVAEAEVGGIELATSATATCHCSAVEVFNCVVPIVGQGV